MDYVLSNGVKHFNIGPTNVLLHKHNYTLRRIKSSTSIKTNLNDAIGKSRHSYGIRRYK